jgi:osmotically-inducible protein OsmY/uncharacterized membrane protein
MSPKQISRINSDEYSRCTERQQVPDHTKDLSPIQKTDAAIREYIYHTFWKDDVLRAIEYDEIEVHVLNGIVHLNGHIVSVSNGGRIENAIRAIPGILGINNNLIMDDQLTHEVAAALGELEHTYDCKFFTGVSHGVVSLNGTVDNGNVKLLAEQYAARTPKVRGVVNHILVAGSESEFQDLPFLQPVIGENIYFQDGVSGVVSQVIMNPNNRRVTAMLIRGSFNDEGVKLKSSAYDQAPFQEQLVAVPMNVVRYLTRISGFLYINSHEKNRYEEFDPAAFISPDPGWVSPHPYCPEDVLFPVNSQSTSESESVPFAVLAADVAPDGQVKANDSLGG